jgi:hypothetical protein
MRRGDDGPAAVGRQELQSASNTSAQCSLFPGCLCCCCCCCAEDEEAEDDEDVDVLAKRGGMGGTQAWKDC